MYLLYLVLYLLRTPGLAGELGIIRCRVSVVLGVRGRCCWCFDLPVTLMALRRFSPASPSIFGLLSNS